MLSYSWNKLEESKIVQIDLDGITTLPDLFARVLLSGTNILFKRGLEKSFVEHTEEILGIKGKLELSATLKAATLLRQRAICTFDELSYDSLANQILFSTLSNLINAENMSLANKKELKRCLKNFVNISRIRITARHFSLIRFHRNNSFYIFLMDVCQIIHDSALPSEQPGKWSFMDFTRDENKMWIVFQSFVKRFYYIKYKDEYKVTGTQIKWQLEGDPDGKIYLPIMNTDVCLENRKSKIIIETKFYNETMSNSYGKDKITATHLYQLFAYLVNQETDDPKTLSCAGILLYPTTNREYDLSYKYKKHHILIKTINLNQDWPQIENRLHEAIALS